MGISMFLLSVKKVIQIKKLITGIFNFNIGRVIHFPFYFRILGLSTFSKITILFGT